MNPQGSTRLTCLKVEWISKPNFHGSHPGFACCCSYANSFGLRMERTADSSAITLRCFFFIRQRSEGLTSRDPFLFFPSCLVSVTLSVLHAPPPSSPTAGSIKGRWEPVEKQIYPKRGLTDALHEDQNKRLRSEWWCAVEEFCQGRL